MKARVGLRERKKRMQRQELLEIAARLFRQHGFDATRMEDIAAPANVSTMTVYNYFPNKQNILAALLQEDRTRLVSAYEAVLENPPASLPEAIAALMYADIGEVLTVDDKKLWRELIAAEMKTSNKEDAELSTNKSVFLKYIERLLLYFKQNGIFCNELSVKISSETIYALYYYSFIDYCRSDEMSTEKFHDNLVIKAETLVKSWQQ